MSNNLKRDIGMVNGFVYDDTLRHIVFGNDDVNDDLFLGQTNELYRYFNNIMEIAFFFVYGRFKQWQRVSPRYEKYTPEKGTRNFNRIVAFFEQLYCIKDLKPDNISDVLIDLQIDITKSGSVPDIEGDEDLYQALNDFFLKYDIVSSSSYNECDYLAKQYISSNVVDDPLKGEGSNVLDRRRDTLIELLSITFPFFTKLSAEIKPIQGLKKVEKNGMNVQAVDSQLLKEIVFTYHNTGRTETRNMYELPDEIPLNLTLVASPRYYFYLERIDRYVNPKNGRQIPVLNYIRMANSPFTYSVYILRSDDRFEDLPDKALFIQDDKIAAMINNVYFAFERKASKATSMIKDFATINYRYIKKLSLSLCDILNSDGKQALYQKYGREHPELFDNNNPDNLKELAKDEMDKIDWDSSIAVLLVDEGATMVLRTIMLRCKDAEAFFSNLCNNLQARLGEKTFSSAKVVKGAYEEWRSLRDKRNKYSRMDMIPNEIREDFDCDESFFKSEVNANYLVDELSRISGSAKNKAHYALPVSIIARNKMLEMIKRSPLSIEQRLNGLVLLANQTMVQLVAFYEGFFSFASEVKAYNYDINRTKSAIKKIQETANQAFVNAFYETYERLNKEENFNSETIFQEIDRLNKESSSPNSANPTNNAKYVYTKYFLGRKSFVDITVFEKIKVLSYISTDEYEEALKLVEEMFNYLRTGCVPGETKKGNETAIYPYVATHLFDHETRDGFVIKHFEVLAEDDTEHDIKVLSDFQYSVNHRYYCLPSSLRYNRNIDVWIEPILIDYNVFEAEKWN